MHASGIGSCASTVSTAIWVKVRVRVRVRVRGYGHGVGLGVGVRGRGRGRVIGLWGWQPEVLNTQAMRAFKAGEWQRCYDCASEAILT